jgi:hypothetical protein
MIGMRTVTRRRALPAEYEQNYGELTWVVGRRVERHPALAKVARRRRRTKDMVTAGRRVAWMVSSYQAASLPRLVRRTLRIPTESAS